MESLYDTAQIKDLFNKSRIARCRGRFAVPVILFEGKVCVLFILCNKSFPRGNISIDDVFAFCSTYVEVLPYQVDLRCMVGPALISFSPVESPSQCRIIRRGHQQIPSKPNWTSYLDCCDVLRKFSSLAYSEWQLFNRVRGQDIKVLKMFSVGYIVDLMVEKKKVKFGMKWVTKMHSTISWITM